MAEIPTREKVTEVVAKELMSTDLTKKTIALLAIVARKIEQARQDNPGKSLDEIVDTAAVQSVEQMVKEIIVCAYGELYDALYPRK